MRRAMTLAILVSLYGFSFPPCFGAMQTGAAPKAPAPPKPSASEVPRREVRQVEELLPQLADRGAALYFLARRYAQLGDSHRALDLLKQCISLDEGFDPTDAPAFQSLTSDREFQQLADHVRRRYPPVHQAHVAFTIQETDLFPEGLAADPERKLFYMGSMHRKKIVKISETGATTDFVRSDAYNLMPVGGVKVDPVTHDVWAATDPGTENRSELLHFDSNGKLLGRFPAPGPGPHDLNDLVLRSSDEIYVTDTAAHQVYRFDGKRRTFTPLALPRPLFYPNGITVSATGEFLYFGDILGVMRVDLARGSAQEVVPGKNSTLAGIDGLYWYKGTLLGVQYGAGASRVVRWALSADGLHVTSTEILEYRSPLVSFPTTGTIVGNSFYFIANTGIGNLKDDAIVDPMKLEPIHIAVLQLK